MEVPNAELIISGRFAYTSKRNSPKEGRAKTEVYRYRRKVRVAFPCWVFREVSATNASAPTSQFWSLRGLLYYCILQMGFRRNWRTYGISKV